MGADGDGAAGCGFAGTGAGCGETGVTGAGTTAGAGPVGMRTMSMPVPAILTTAAVGRSGCRPGAKARVAQALSDAKAASMPATQATAPTDAPNATAARDDTAAPAGARNAAAARDAGADRRLGTGEAGRGAKRTGDTFAQPEFLHDVPGSGEPVVIPTGENAPHPVNSQDHSHGYLLRDGRILLRGYKEAPPISFGVP